MPGPDGAGGDPYRYEVMGFRDGMPGWIVKSGRDWFASRPVELADHDRGPHGSPEDALAALQAIENQYHEIRTCTCGRRTRVTMVTDPEKWPDVRPTSFTCPACNRPMSAMLDGTFVDAKLLPHTPHTGA